MAVYKTVPKPGQLNTRSVIIAPPQEFINARAKFVIIGGRDGRSIYLFSICLGGTPLARAASTKTPWGIVTSFFVHDDEAHLLNNMVSLFLFLMLFFVSNSFLTEREIKARFKTVFLAIFSIPAILNLLIIIFYPELKIIGSSGIVYALEGMCLGYSFLNTLELRTIQNSLKNQKRLLLVSSLSNLIIIIGFLLGLIFYPQWILAGGGGIIFWFHCMTLSCSFLFSICYPLWYR
jgi:membrane associated rhomboid family serine protease